MSYNPNKESGADYFARTPKQEFKPQSIQQRPSSEMPEPFYGKPFEPDEYGIVPQMLPFEGTTFDDTPTPGLDETPIAETAVYENEPGQPSGSFSMGGVNYKQVNGKWTALKPDGTPMTPGEMYNHTSKRHSKPGQVTGRPLSNVSRLFNQTPGRLAEMKPVNVK